MPETKKEINEINEIKLSPSSLNLFMECPKCFWLEHVQGIHRPKGIFPSLPSGMDIALKKYFDKFRPALPPELKGKVEGSLLSDSVLLKKWRNWRTGLNFRDETNAILSGALDDCLVKDNLYIPVDYKTRGFALKEDTTSSYQNQLDCYCLLLEKNGYKHAGFAYLIFYIPKEVQENNLVKFDVEVVKMPTDTTRALKIFRDAVLALKGPMPMSHSECAYCVYGRDYIEE